MAQTHDGNQVEVEDRRERPDHAWSIQVLSLPETWARSDRRTRYNLKTMIQSYTDAIIIRVHTSENCTNSPAPGEAKYCYAFFDVTDEDQGKIFIRQIGQVTIDGVRLQPRWSSKAQPRNFARAHTVLDTATGRSQQWHPRDGLSLTSDTSDHHRTGQGGGAQSMVSITYTPQEHGLQSGHGGVGVVPADDRADHTPTPLALALDVSQPALIQLVVGNTGWEDQVARRSAQEAQPTQSMEVQVRPARTQERVRHWDDQDTFQAILQRGDKVLLTTYHHDAHDWLETRQVRHPNTGTMLDYHTMPTCEVWIAEPTQTTALQAQEWLWQARRGAWIGAQWIVVDPNNVQVRGADREGHRAFLSIQGGQQLTALSPPIWTWTDDTRMAGLWCLMMCTYHTNTSRAIAMTAPVSAGLVPMSTIDELQVYD